jgi:NADPH:quinone reductase-like Zn-dependent oxidoreductase
MRTAAPEVLRYEDADPEPADGEVLVELRRLRSIISMSDSQRASFGAWVAHPRRHGAMSWQARTSAWSSTWRSYATARSTSGETADGTHAELIAVPRDAVHPIPTTCRSRKRPRFLVFETAYRMLVPRPACNRTNGC